MSHAEALESFAVKSYRYLRWSIVLVVLALIASVLIEAHRVKWCYEESISAYYYTPVHAVFVGALVTIGVSLIAIKGSTDWEDVLLNLAGVLAPIVAFVPTERPGRRCSSIEAIVGELQPYINNNVLAFALGGAAALLLVFGFILFKRRSTFRQFRAQSLTVLIAGVAILVAGAVWYAMFRQHFLKYAHLGAAVGMFAVVGFVILLNALHRRGQRKSWLPYAGIAGAMALSGVSVWAVDQFGGGWRHKVLWLELLELTAFAVFWVAQTFEHWDGGAPTGAERQI